MSALPYTWKPSFQCRFIATNKEMQKKVKKKKLFIIYHPEAQGINNLFVAIADLT